MSTHKVKSVRFQKYDEYKNAIFAANITHEPTAYKSLSRFHRKLSKQFECFLPIYSNKELHYATIRLKPNQAIPAKLTTHDVYDITFRMRTGQRDGGNRYISCIPSKVKLVKKAAPEGEDVIISDSEDDSE